MAIPGTNSNAIQNPDGTWDILDVPVCHEGVIPRFGRNGEKVDDWQVTVAWFHQIIQTHAMREREGYMGRSFIDHHAAAEKSQPDAGFLRPNAVGSIMFKGERIAALMANLVSIPDKVYREWIKSGRMPYRSIESLRAESGFVDGLALMPTRPPHFQLPMLTIGSETPLAVSSGTPPPSSLPVEAVACASSEQAQAAILRSVNMAEIKGEKKPDEEGRDDSPIEEGAEAPIEEAPAEGEAPAEAPAEEAAPEEAAAPSAPWAEMIESLKAVEVAAEDIPSFVAELMAFVDTLETPDQGGDEFSEEPIIEEASVDETPIAEQPVAAGGASARIIKAEALATAAKAESSAIKKDLATRDAVDAACMKLADYNLGSDPKAHLMAKAKEHGVYGLALYVETVIAHAPRSPGISAEGDDLGHAPLTDLPDEVMAYTEPAQREAALVALRSWRQQEDAGWPMEGRNLKSAINREVRRIGAGS